MLDLETITRLVKANEDRAILSVYVSGRAPDPAKSGAWRRRLNDELRAARRTLEPLDPDELERFDSAMGRVTDELSSFRGNLPHDGWVAFATPERLLWAGGTAVEMPCLVRWQRGPFIAPSIRAAKQGRAVLVALSDARRCRMFRYADGRAEEFEDLLADRFPEDISDLGIRGGVGSGIQGTARKDAAQRSHRAELGRLARRVAKVVMRESDDATRVLIGGTPEAAGAIAAELPTSMADRAERIEGLPVEARVAEVESRVADEASELTERFQTRLLDWMAEQVHGEGRAAVGSIAATKALEHGAVETLLLSRRFIRDSMDRADILARWALLQGAEVQELGGGAGEELDRIGKGVGARLRFARGAAV